MDAEKVSDLVGKVGTDLVKYALRKFGEIDYIHMKLPKNFSPSEIRPDEYLEITVGKRRRFWFDATVSRRIYISETILQSSSEYP